MQKHAFGDFDIRGHPKTVYVSNDSQPLTFITFEIDEIDVVFLHA